VHALIRAVYHLLGLRTFLTTGKRNHARGPLRRRKGSNCCRNYPFRFERGFIAAETISYDDLIAAGSVGKSRETGKIRLEGKD